MLLLQVTQSNVIEDETLLSLFVAAVRNITPTATLDCIKRVQKYCCPSYTTAGGMNT